MAGEYICGVNLGPACTLNLKGNTPSRCQTSPPLSVSALCVCAILTRRLLPFNIWTVHRRGNHGYESSGGGDRAHVTRDNVPILEERVSSMKVGRGERGHTQLKTAPPVLFSPAHLSLRSPRKANLGTPPTRALTISTILPGPPTIQLERQ